MRGEGEVTWVGDVEVLVGQGIVVRVTDVLWDVEVEATSLGGDLSELHHPLLDALSMGDGPVEVRGTWCSSCSTSVCGSSESEGGEELASGSGVRGDGVWSQGVGEELSGSLVLASGEGPDAAGAVAGFLLTL